MKYNDMYTADYGPVRGNDQAITQSDETTCRDEHRGAAAPAFIMNVGKRR